MNFKKQKIGKKNIWKTLREPLKSRVLPQSFLKATLLGITCSLIIGGVLFAFVKKIDIETFIQPLEKDSWNHTNILLLGTGTEAHEGSDLTDSIIIASFNHEKNFVSMISLPRDFYVETEFGSMRINQIYERGIKTATAEKGLQVLRDTLEKILGIDIHYYAKINFNGFIELIDTLKGVDIEIPQTIIDQSYPKGETFQYETFILEKGLQHLDGETALKYARTRKCNICFDGDFGRAKRQQELLKAIKEKMLRSETWLHPTKIKEILQTIQKNFSTDLKITGILYLANKARQQNEIFSWLIHDNPETTGGFLYVPERKYYGGAFVLVPWVNEYREIKQYTELILRYPEAMQKADTIKILNGTKHNGLALLALRYLSRYGFNVIGYGNNIERKEMKTIIYDMKQQNSDIFPLIQSLIPGEISQSPPETLDNEEGNDMMVILGEDFYEFYRANQNLFY